MALYVISYDQHRDKDYTPIWTYLGGIGAVRILESVWLVESNQAATDLRENIRRASMNEDSLIMIQVFNNSGWAAYQARQPGVDWLKRHIP